MPVTWDRMIADASGRLWLRYSGCANDQERIWDIVDTSGTRRGWFRTRNHIIAAYDSFFLARGADSLGVPAITRWRIVRR
jgi:hypothetical protein